MRIPIGAVGANFEARPNVALDVAAQLLKSLNTAVLRTGGAALRTVTALVDDVLRPALEQAGLPPGAVGLVRSSDREGARVLVTLPQEVPLVILRGSGETTASLARLAAEHGVRTLAHAEGGGVLYAHGSASREGAGRRGGEPGSAGRLQPAEPLPRRSRAVGLLPDLLELFRRLGLDVRATERARRPTDAGPLDVRLGHEWANDSDRVATVTSTSSTISTRRSGSRTPKPRGSQPRSSPTTPRRRSDFSMGTEGPLRSGRPRHDSLTGSC